MIGYEYLFENANGFSMICYNKGVNYLVDQFDGEFTHEDIISILKILNKERCKWWSTIDELCLLEHFMKEKGVDKIIVVRRDIKLGRWLYGNVQL